MYDLMQVIWLKKPVDIVIFADKEERIVSDKFVSKASNSLIIGEKHKVAKYTICDGEVVYRLIQKKRISLRLVL